MPLKVVVFLALLMAVACDKAEVASPVEPEVEMTREGKLGYLEAQEKVLRGVQLGLGAAVRATPQDTSSASNQVKEVAAEGHIFTLHVGGNNHGETEDCGCKANPLGGLARRARMMELSLDPTHADAVKWWGETKRGEATLVAVDAGDFFYKNPTLAKAAESTQAQAKYDALTAAMALKQMPIDVFLAGELDLVFGTENFTELMETSGKKFISANLMKDSKPWLEPTFTFERNGQKVGVIGLTRQKSRLSDFWSERGLEVKDPVESYKAAWPSLAGANLKILLSNLGHDETRAMLEGLEASERPHVVVLSGSNRLTQRPEWVGDTALVEALSQGKYALRADIFRNGAEFTGFQNKSVNPQMVMRDYQKALSVYVGAKARFNKAERALLELPADVEPGRREFAEKERGMFWTRVQISSQELAEAAESVQSQIAGSQSKTTGSDYIDLRAVALKLDVPQVPSIEALVAQRKKKRPEFRPTNDHAGHDHAGHDHAGHKH